MHFVLGEITKEVLVQYSTQEDSKHPEPLNIT
jgi:hypothetical protein